MADATGDTETDKHLGVFIIHVFRWESKTTDTVKTVSLRYLVISKFRNYYQVYKKQYHTLKKEDYPCLHDKGFNRYS